MGQIQTYHLTLLQLGQSVNMAFIKIVAAALLCGMAFADKEIVDGRVYDCAVAHQQPGHDMKTLSSIMTRHACGAECATYKPDKCIGFDWDFFSKHCWLSSTPRSQVHMTAAPFWSHFWHSCEETGSSRSKRASHGHGHGYGHTTYHEYTTVEYVKKDAEKKNAEPAPEKETAEDEPAVEETVKDEPAVEETVEDEPAVEESVEDEPEAEEESVEDEPAVEESVEDEPAVEEETVEDEPAAEESVEDEPAAEETAEDEPAAEEETAEDEPAAEE